MPKALKAVPRISVWSAQPSCACCNRSRLHACMAVRARHAQVDMCSMEEVSEIAHRADSIPISCQLKLNMDGLLEKIWEMMALVGGV